MLNSEEFPLFHKHFDLFNVSFCDCVQTENSSVYFIFLAKDKTLGLHAPALCVPSWAFLIICYCSRSLLDALQLQVYLVCLDLFLRLAPVPSKRVKLLRKLRKKLCSTWRNTFISPVSFTNNYYFYVHSDKSPAITTLVCVASVLRAVLCLFPQGSL